MFPQLPITIVIIVIPNIDFSPPDKDHCAIVIAGSSLSSFSHYWYVNQLHILINIIYLQHQINHKVIHHVRSVLT